MKQHTDKRAPGWAAAVLLAGSLALGACGGGGGGSGGSAGGGGAAGPSQPGGTVPDSAMDSMANFLRFMTSWAVDDTIEPFALSDRPPPGDGGDARPVD